ncbi:MAG: type II toxin-antitoxin system VapB family antitoxin [Candidatus Binatia bacterium]
MPLNIKNAEVEKLAAEVAAKTGETRTEAVRRALLERKAKLDFQIVRPDRRSSVEEFLRREIWPLVPKGKRGRAPTKREREEMLGYGAEGV